MHRILVSAWLLLPGAAVMAQAADPATPAVASAVEAPEAAAPATPLPTDRRERVIAVCMNEARAKAAAAGIQEVSLRDTQDTDLKSDGYASMRGKVELVRVDAKGRTKKTKGTFGCATRGDVVTRFEFDR